MADVGGSNGWEVHPVARLPFQKSQFRVCQECCHHAIDISKDIAAKMAEDMGKVWRHQGDGEGNRKLREERDEARAEIDALKRQLEEMRKKADTRKDSKLPGKSWASSLSEGESKWSLFLSNSPNKPFKAHRTPYRYSL